MDPEPSVKHPADPQQRLQQQSDPLSFDPLFASHAEKVCQLIISAINEAAINFERPPSPTTTVTPQQQHLHSFLASMQPSLSNNLRLLQLYLQTNIFSLPSNISNTASLPSLLSSETVLKSNQQKINSLDSQITSLRAKIHNCDKSIQQTALKKAQNVSQNSVLSTIQVDKLATSSKLVEQAVQSIKSSSTDLNATITSISSNNQVHSTNKLISAAAAAASHLTQANAVKPTATAAFQSDSLIAHDEHGPLTTTTMPPVIKIFKTPANQQARDDQAPQISYLQALLYDCQ